MSATKELIQNDIEKYLNQHENKDMLRLITCGSVDDGKSTLIGRLLYESQTLTEDQLRSVESDSVKHGTQETHRTLHCWWTDWQQSANKALLLMLLIATSILISVSLLLLTPLGMSNTHAI